MSSKRAFSVFELFIVLAIISVLTAAVIPQYRAYSLRSRRVEAKTKLAELKGALDSFYAEYRVYAPCFGSMGIQWTGGWYGITTAATNNDTTTPLRAAAARAAGAFCPDAPSGALPLNNTAFPPTRISGSCRYAFSQAIGHINLHPTSIHVNIGGFLKDRCVGTYYPDRETAYEIWYIDNSPGTNLVIKGPWACAPGNCNSIVPVE